MKKLILIIVFTLKTIATLVIRPRIGKRGWVVKKIHLQTWRHRSAFRALHKEPRDGIRPC